MKNAMLIQEVRLYTIPSEYAFVKEPLGAFVGAAVGALGAEDVGAVFARL